MDIKEIKQKRSELENQFYALIENFVKETGVEIKDIRVHMIPETSINSKRFLFAGIDVILEI